MTWSLTANSLVLAAIVTCGATFVGVAAGIAAACSGGITRKSLITAGVVALLLPSFLTTNAWISAFGISGWWAGKIDVYSLPAAAAILAGSFWGIPMFATLAGLRRIERPQLEFDRAVRGWLALRWLVWPACASAVRVAAIAVFVLALSSVSTPVILQTPVLPVHLWVQYSTDLNATRAVLAGVPLVVAPLALLLLWRPKLEPLPFKAPEIPEDLLRSTLGAPLVAVLASTAIVGVLVSVVFPLAHLVFASATWSQLPLAFSAARNAVLHSGGYALITALACGAVGLVVGRYAGLGILWLGFFLPGIFVGLATIELFSSRMLAFAYGTSAVVIVGCVVRYAALAWGSIRTAHLLIDSELIDAARVEGVRGWRRFAFVEWPQIAPAAVLGTYLVYVLCLWDVETTLLLLPPGGETLAAKIFNLLHYGHTGQVNALCLMLIVLALLPLPVVLQSSRRRE